MSNKYRMWTGQIDRAMLGSLELGPILDVVLQAVLDLTGATDADILLATEKGLHLERYTRPWAEGTVTDVVEGKAGIINWVAEQRESMLIPDVYAEPWRSRYVSGLTDIRSELAVPILDQEDALLGVINVEHDEPNALNYEHQETLVGIARQAALAIDRARRYEKFKRTLREREILRSFEQQLSQAVEEGEMSESEMDIYRLMVEAAMDFTYADRGEAFLYDPDRQQLHLVASLPMETGQLPIKLLGEGIVGWVAEQRKALVIPDVRDEQYYSLYPAGQEKTRSVLTVPMLDRRERLVGVINLESQELDKFRDGDQEFVHSLVSQILKTRRNLATLRRYRSLVDISYTALSEKEPEEVIEEILHKVLEQRNTSLADIVFYDENGRARGGWAAVRHAPPSANDFLVDVYPLPEEDFQIYEGGIMAHVARTGYYYLASNTQDDPYYQPVPTQPEVASELAVFLGELNGRGKGVLNIESRVKGNFIPDDVDFYQTFANQVATVLRLADERKKGEALLVQREYEQWLVETAAISTRLRHRFGNDLGHWPHKLKILSQKAEELNEQSMKQELLAMSDTIQVALAILSTMVEGARIRGEAAQTPPDAVIVAELLDEVLEEYDQASISGTEVILNLGDVAAEKVQVPRGAIVDALGNIYRNALSILQDQDDGRVEIAARRTGVMVVISITDNGPGIANKDQDSIFEFGITRRREQGGTGIGLWLAQGAIKASGGTLELDRSWVQGARFLVSLPIADGQVDPGRKRA